MSDGTSYAWPMAAMVFKSGRRELLETYLDDDSVCFQQKVDGTRVLVKIEPGKEPDIRQRDGAPLKHAASLVALPPIMKVLREASWGMMILDGELMWSEGKLVLFDLPYASWPLAPVITMDTPYERREARIEQVVEMFDTGLICQVGSAKTPEGKQALVDAIKEMNGEGVMIKRLDAPYTQAKRVTHSLKIKFTKTVDVIVTSYELGRNEDGNLSGSIGFALLHEPVEGFDATVGFAWHGSCSAIGRECKVGDVIEVEYLAYMAGGGIREPRMVRVREDKSPAECTIGQLTEHSRVVL